jgi:hypothetical protein
MLAMFQTLQWQRHRERHSVTVAPVGRWLDEQSDAPKPPNQRFHNGAITAAAG